MKLFVLNKPDLVLPTQANEGEDAAYDIVVTTRPMIHGEGIERPLDSMKLWRRVAFIEYGTNLYLAPESEDVVKWSPDLARGIQWESMPISYHTQLWPRSSISKLNLILANSIGLVDTGYRNQVLLRFKYCFQPEDFIVVQEDVLRVYGRVNDDHLYHIGDKAVQIKAAPNVPITFERVAELPTSKRNLGGFGSSGK